ncbi:MAG: carbamoyltransferase HypF, partial [Nitrospiraceae bacterium]|nr:carbamoyltransferase HypF [Nitrospiraceae bacterium]
MRLVIRGAVQGVGFRPFVYRLAAELGCRGWVCNSAQGVVIDVENSQDVLDAFLMRVEREKPPRASIQSLEPVYLDPAGYEGFEIRASSSGAKTTPMLPDIATCPDCLREIRDSANRRRRYPFTNCTNCGPRFSIIEALPYDRPNTTMKVFAMCDACRAEYEDPLDRRFHAQPNACPACGPHLEWWTPQGAVTATHEEALQAAVAGIRAGRTVAVKGLGGFHLMVDARNEKAVKRLRLAKAREEKPFAAMYPSLESVREDCAVDELEARLLQAPEAPIVLLDHRASESRIAPSVAPDNPHLGVMLPYTPLHHLLLDELGFPVVATSGNRSEEPICTDETEALERLAGLADGFLVHNRPIARHVDDSVARVLLRREQVLRRARGYAPLPIVLPQSAPTLLAVGAHLKNTIALSVGNQVFVSQHIGDLETPAAFGAFGEVVSCFKEVYEAQPATVACDAHPDYLSTQFARDSGLEVVPVQHHYAHVLACMAENEVEAPVLGVSWDGTGFGTDGTVWGGEFFLVTDDAYERVAHLRTFPLPGGERAVREPRRSALGLLYELLGDDVFEMDELPAVAAFEPRERALIRTALEKGINTPRTSSAGRLFDAVAGIVGLHPRIRFEGQAAMALEFLLPECPGTDHYPFSLEPGSEPEAGGAIVVNWGEMVRAVLRDVSAGMAVAAISARFHNTLAEMIGALAGRVGAERVVLTGGCFQNAYLTERTVWRLCEDGRRPYWHQRIPPNDGGIALGQIVAAAHPRRAVSSFFSREKKEAKKSGERF